MTPRHFVFLLLVLVPVAFFLSCASTYNLSGISITPSAASVGPNGATTQFTATALYIRSSHPQEVKDVTNQVTWASSDTSVATINSSGLATAVGAGSTTITATMNGFSASASMDVTIGAGSLTALTIIPPAGAQQVYATGQTAQFIAIGTFSAGPATQDMTDQVTWISADVDVAVINSTGLATSLPCTTPSGLGCKTIITASFNSLAGAGGPFTASSDLTTNNDANNPPLPSLTVYELGQGTGTVVSTSEQGINCGSGPSCTANFPLNSTVTLSATADSGSTFVGWSSNCNGGTNLTNPICTIPMQNNQTVGAIFALNPTP